MFSRNSADKERIAFMFWYIRQIGLHKGQKRHQHFVKFNLYNNAK